MAQYAVGDLQGCLKPLQCLLEQVNFNPQHDQLWLVGDLVSRGPDSLDTLRYLYSIKDSLRITLGNHDLHFIALALGTTDRGKHPSLDALLTAADCSKLMQWLLQQALVLRSEDGRYLMSHAGIPHNWTSEQALVLSREVEAVLQGSNPDEFFRNMYGDEPLMWNDNLRGYPRLRAITNHLTRMRVCNADGQLEFSFKGIAADIPAPYQPWFAWQTESSRSETLIFGHWAALECQTGRDDIIALDSGCVWGRHMTMLNMDNRDIYRCECKA